MLPDQAQPMQRSQLIAAFSIGIEIIELRRLCRQFDLALRLDTALEAVARGNCAIAAAELVKLDRSLASRRDVTALRARGLILAISQSLTQHSLYFDARVPG